MVMAVLILKVAVLFISLLPTATCSAVNHCLDEKCTLCEENYYGSDCQYLCPINCDSGCHRISAQCDHQCKLNYTGRFCELSCPPDCRQGCNQTTATCHGGCYPRLYGKFCNLTCSEDCYVCDRIDGQCITHITTVRQKDSGNSSVKRSVPWVFPFVSIGSLWILIVQGNRL